MYIPEYARALVWFRRDIRCYDHALYYALKQAHEVRSRDKAPRLAMQLGVEALFFNHDDEPPHINQTGHMQNRFADDHC